MEILPWYTRPSLDWSPFYEAVSFHVSQHQEEDEPAHIAMKRTYEGIKLGVQGIIGGAKIKSDGIVQEGRNLFLY